MGLISGSSFPAPIWYVLKNPFSTEPLRPYACCAETFPCPSPVFCMCCANPCPFISRCLTVSYGWSLIQCLMLHLHYELFDYYMLTGLLLDWGETGVMENASFLNSNSAKHWTLGWRYPGLFLNRSSKAAIWRGYRAKNPVRYRISIFLGCAWSGPKDRG